MHIMFKASSRYIPSSTKNIGLYFYWNIRWRKGMLRERAQNKVQSHHRTTILHQTMSSISGVCDECAGGQ
jgi:hypothetical protein